MPATDAAPAALDTAPFLPMEARAVAQLPGDDGWQFEPKWDGFRCLAIRRGGETALFGKSGKPLGRYFPEAVAAVGAFPGGDFILDGELVIPVGDSLDFDALQMRLHPAESRILKLAAETPAVLIVFDLVDSGGRDFMGLPLVQRRAALEHLFAGVGRESRLLLSPATRELAQAQAWLDRAGGALDGVVAKRLDQAYMPDERAMLKVKHLRTADCVVGGFRYGTDSTHVASLLLGLYDDAGLLHHVGFTSGLAAADREMLTRRLEALRGGTGFSGRAPGGPSRWSTARSASWEPLRPELVVEVRYDHVTADRFRHGTGLVRWRPDKAPHQCTLEQLRPEARPAALADTFSSPPPAL